jgi:uncharacterized protein
VIADPYARGASRLILASLVAASFVGCGGLLKRPQVNHYALEPIAADARHVEVAGPPVGLGAVELPPGLDRPDIVVRSAPGRFEVRGTELWPASLGTVVLHRVAFELAARLPQGMVILPGQVQPAGAARALDLAFAELTAGPDANLVVDVRWTLRAGVGGAQELAGHERIVEPLGSLDSVEVARGTSRALAALADRLAAALAVTTPAR